MKTIPTAIGAAKIGWRKPNTCAAAMDNKLAATKKIEGISNARAAFFLQMRRTRTNKTTIGITRAASGKAKR